MTDTTTTAYAVAERFGHQGDMMQTPDGMDIHSACLREAADPSHHAIGQLGLAIRYAFPDGSAIVVRHDPEAMHGQCWDIGWADCWCWDTEGHVDGCPEEGVI